MIYLKVKRKIGKDIIFIYQLSSNYKRMKAIYPDWYADSIWKDNTMEKTIAKGNWSNRFTYDILTKQELKRELFILNL